MHLSEKITNAIGNWKFVIVLSFITFFWVLWNNTAPVKKRFDPYPYILLNLSYSFMAGYTAPILLMAAKRQSEIDRKRSIKNFELDKLDHKKLEKLANHIDHHFDQFNEKLNKLQSKD
jgi:uncharacterized membrane protein